MRKGITRLTIVALLVVLQLGVSGKAAGGTLSWAVDGWLAGWADRIRLTIDHTSIDSDLSDFPVLIHLSPASGTTSADVSAIFSTLGDDSRKIALTTADGTTQSYVEIERWDSSSRHAYLWARIPNLSSKTETVLYLYYDASQADNDTYVGLTGSAAAQNVWDGNYAAVWHLDQSGKGIKGEFKDSTASHHDGTGGDAGESPSPAPSKMGLSQFFNGTANHITIADHDDFSVTTTTELTISFWLSPAAANFKNSVDSLINIMGKGFVGAYEWSFVFYNRDGTDRTQRISFYVDNPEGGAGSGSYSQEPIGLNEWLYITAMVSEGHTLMYRNGALSRRDPYTGPQAFIDVRPQNGAEPVRIGTRDLDTSFEGRMDEVRVSNVARSASWVKASYLSETDQLIGYETVDDDPPVLRPIGNKEVTVEQPLEFVVSAIGRTGRPLVYNAYNLPPGSEFDPSTGTFSWTPGPSQAGTYSDIRFEVSSGRLNRSESITVAVIQPDRLDAAPVLVGGFVLTAAALSLIAWSFLPRSRRWCKATEQKQLVQGGDQ